MPSPLTSQGLVLATAMAVSAGTVILFDLFRERYVSPLSHVAGNNPDSPPDDSQVLKSCLSSGGKKKKKKKRVHFADDVKDSKGNGEVYRKQHRRKSAEIQKKSCGNEILGLEKMPANRVALYGGIMKNRMQSMEYSY